MPNRLMESLEFGEGPAFTSDGELWCTEIVAGTLSHWTGEGLDRHLTNGAPSAIKFDAEDRAVICDGGQNAIRRFDPVENEWATLVESVDGERVDAPNDLAFGPEGSLVFTCPGPADTYPFPSYVCCREPDGTVKKIKDELYVPNGIAFNEDGSELIVAETMGNRLWKGEWDTDTFEWVDPEPWADVGGPTGPDGMALGEDGLMYVAVFGTGEVRGVDASGDIAERVEFPGYSPTNVAFDPVGDLGMVVTGETGGLVSYPDRGPGVEVFRPSTDGWVGDAD